MIVNSRSLGSRVSAAVSSGTVRGTFQISMKSAPIDAPCIEWCCGGDASDSTTDLPCWSWPVTMRRGVRVICNLHLLRPSGDRCTTCAPACNTERDCQIRGLRLRTPGLLLQCDPHKKKGLQMNAWSICVPLLAMLTVSSVLAASPEPADSVLLNGKILVFARPERNDGPSRPSFEQALAIRGERIVFVGTSADARRFAGPGTRVNDLGGRMVMPGIVDGHFHGTRSSDCEMGYEGGTVAQVLAKLQACLDRPEQAVHKGTNVRFYATQFFGEALMPEGTALTREDLDRLDTTRPVRLRNADGHKFWMNSRAIANAHIDAATPVPPGGQIGRDASGRPNGFFADIDIEQWGETLPDSEAALVDLVRRTNA